MAHPTLAVPSKSIPDSLFRTENALAAALLNKPLSSRQVGVDRGTICLRIRTTGHAGRSSNTSAVSTSISHFKQIIQLCKVHKFGFKKDFISAQFRAAVGVYAIEDKGEVAQPIAVNVSEEFLNLLSTLTIETQIHQPVGLLYAGPVQKTASVSEVIDLGFSRFQALFSAPEGNQDALRLQAALEWAFDSTLSGNETQAFIQACIGIEAIIGPQGVVHGLTDKLADRCAFLLGRTMQERRAIASSFDAIYSLRSDLVHGRSKKLKFDEHRLLKQAQELLARLLVAETGSFS
jgi:hypothetical protein